MFDRNRFGLHPSEFDAEFQRAERFGKVFAGGMGCFSVLFVIAFVAIIFYNVVVVPTLTPEQICSSPMGVNDRRCQGFFTTHHINPQEQQNNE
jgi:hypothetical protein